MSKIKLKKPNYVDMFELPENKRCEFIGEKANKGEVCCFVVEDNEKADRYVKKINNRYSTVIELGRWNGPSVGMITVKVGLPESEN